MTLTELLDDAIRAQISLEVWQAIRALLEADDPEPQWWHGREVYDAWRNRQALRDKLMEVLG